MGELPVHAHVGRDLQKLGQVEGEAEDEDGRQVDHQPPPAPHPRVQRVADPAVTLNTEGGKVQFSRFNITNPQMLKVIWHACSLYPPDGDGEVHGGDEGAAAHGDAEEEDGLEDVPVVPLQQALGPANQYSTVQFTAVQYSKYSTVPVLHLQQTLGPANHACQQCS